jgi:hypothetical protein
MKKVPMQSESVRSNVENQHRSKNGDVQRLALLLPRIAHFLMNSYLGLIWYIVLAALSAALCTFAQLLFKPGHRCATRSSSAVTDCEMIDVTALTFKHSVELL